MTPTDEADHEPCHACLYAMTCPTHRCGCWAYRMPWECDCDKETDQ